MMLPFPHGRAEECAKDLANDCRKMAAEAMLLRDAIATGDAALHDHSQFDLLVRQIESLSNVICVDVETGEEFRVGNYVTEKRRAAARMQQALLHRAYNNLTKWLH